MMNKQISLSIPLRIIAGSLLIIGIIDLSYGYYVFLRWIVCGTSVFIVFLSYKLEKWFSVVLFGIIGVLFNPVVPVYFDKETWVVIDLAVSIIFAISFFFIKRIKEEQE